MKVLVTGASGFIGSYVCESLNEQGIEYVKGTRENFDLNDAESMSEFLNDNQITHVIHLAARADSSDKEVLFTSNIEGLYKLLIALKASGVKHLTFASTNNVYGEESEELINENNSSCPSVANPYALSKYVGEMMIADKLSDTDTKYVLLRVSDVYGPGQRFGNLIKAIVKTVQEKGTLKLYGEGKRTRDFIYVKDVADGMVFSCVNELHGVYNLSTGVGTDVRTLVDIAVGISGGECRVEKIDVKNEDTSKIVLDSQKLKTAGFTAKYSVEEGLRNCVEKVLL